MKQILTREKTLKHCFILIILSSGCFVVILFLLINKYILKQNKKSSQKSRDLCLHQMFQTNNLFKSYWFCYDVVKNKQWKIMMRTSSSQLSKWRRKSSIAPIPTLSVKSTLSGRDHIFLSKFLMFCEYFF